MEFRHYTDSELKKLYKLASDNNNTSNELLLNIYNDYYYTYYGVNLYHLPFEVMDAIKSKISDEIILRFVHKD